MSRERPTGEAPRPLIARAYMRAGEWDTALALMRDAGIGFSLADRLERQL